MAEFELSVFMACHFRVNMRLLFQGDVLEYMFVHKKTKCTGMFY